MTTPTLRAVFFDLDGTLLDTASDLARALNHLLAAEGKAILPESHIRAIVSDGAYAMLELGFGVSKDHPSTAALRERLLALYLGDIAAATTIFPGLAEVIEQLSAHQIAWGIVTNKPEPYAVPLMAKFSFASEPACLLCPEHVRHRKPHAEALHLACKTVGCLPSEAIYVGDHLRDIQCGKNAGMRTIAVNYGYVNVGDSAHNWGADHVVETGHELWPLLQSYIH